MYRKLKSEKCKDYIYLFMSNLEILKFAIIFGYVILQITAWLQVLEIMETMKLGYG